MSVYNVNSDIRFKTAMFLQYSCLCIQFMRLQWCIHRKNKGRITITGPGADAAARQADEGDKGVIFKSCAPFINCKSEL